MIKPKSEPRRSAPPLSEHIIDVNGFKTFTRTSDKRDGTPVVMIHGQGVSSRFESPSARELAEDFEVHVPDQPGFGRSEGPPQALGVDELGDFTAAYVRAYCSSPVALVATSYGCQVAVACAVRHPDIVERLVLQGPPSAPGDRGASRMVQLWIRNSRMEPSSKSDALLLLDDYRRAGFRRVYDTFNAYRLYPISQKLKEVRMPTLVVSGEHDQMVSQEWARTVADLLPKGQLKILSGIAHTMSHFWPRELADAVRPFLEEGAADKPRLGQPAV
ncbi:alpha/beta fold hydrolase [Citreimonas salinaria]|uniref:Pimeloyl-ACP methyl ester carboxylesterase n=1 Tax=Citreimonas salinaria TaxID=321339 RepID=A0A1H3KN47_9RHOB|nr:alpha/beta hydrolase [Citreimonas salinaria]SDY53571.1 Pimeloyl-ACP methyl ester carboxylesterase [Citreimonas salinaria]